MSSQLRVDKIVPVDGVGADSGNTVYGGGIVQVVQNFTSSEVSMTSETFADTGLNCTITPKFQSSKILVIVNQQYRLIRSSSQSGGGFQILRGSTVIQTGPNNSSGSQPFGEYLVVDGASNIEIYSRYNVQYLDTPNTTSSITYKTQMAVRTTQSSAQARAQYQANDENGKSYMTLIEVSA